MCMILCTYSYLLTSVSLNVRNDKYLPSTEKANVSLFNSGVFE